MVRSRSRTERKKEKGRTSKASQEVDSPVVNSGETVRGSRQLKVRDISQLVMPPRRMDRSVGSQALIKRMVQVLQGRGDDPRSTSGAGSDLELSRLEVFSDGRGDGGLWSFPRVDVVGGGRSEPERIRGSGSCGDDESENTAGKVEKLVYAQLEKSSISLFRTMPSEVMMFEPQYKLMAIRIITV